MVYGIYPRCYEAKPSNPEGIIYTTASEESMWLVPQLTAFHQSQAEESIPLGNTFGFRQLREQRPEKCGLCPITLHFSRPLIGGRQATVVQIVLQDSCIKEIFDYLEIGFMLKWIVSLERVVFLFFRTAILETSSSRRLTACCRRTPLTKVTVRSTSPSHCHKEASSLSSRSP